MDWQPNKMLHSNKSFSVCSLNSPLQVGDLKLMIQMLLLIFQSSVMDITEMCLVNMELFSLWLTKLTVYTRMPGLRFNLGELQLERFVHIICCLHLLLTLFSNLMQKSLCTSMVDFLMIFSLPFCCILSCHNAVRGLLSLNYFTFGSNQLLQRSVLCQNLYQHFLQGIGL